MFKLATKLRPSPASLQVAKRSGFTAAEFWTNADSLRRGHDIAALASQFPFTYVIHFPNKPKLQATDLDGAVALYAALQCRAMVIHEPMFRLYGSSLMDLAPNLRLGVENHRLDATEFRAWAEENTWLTLDVEHLWMLTLSGGPLKYLEDALDEFLASYGSKLIHVHLPGYLPGYQEHRPMYCSRDMVLMVLTKLKQAGFDGLVVSEVDREYQNVYDLQMDVLLFERWKELEELPSPNKLVHSTQESL